METLHFIGEGELIYSYNFVGEPIPINFDSCYQLVLACFGKRIPFMGICH